MWPATILDSRVGQNHIYAVYIRYFWQGNHQIYRLKLFIIILYGHIQCIYTVLANPVYESENAQGGPSLNDCAVIWICPFLEHR